ncbi:MAG: GFA family protein [Woeseiaceae bacterium]|nr:GFA family protein [Woeseiaceae bacterium]NIP21795.1 GFA family protein [Woeseiaceae bacterium]NIS90880.1 GFA family protein [Woeseiaceae bacterium]
MTTLVGGCFCGDVRFAVEGPELYACFCHCESCRKSAGGAFVPWAIFPKDGFRLTSGTLTEHHSTPGVTRGHCSRCGTSLTYEHERRAGQIDITLTSFDDPAAINPREHVWVEDKLPWIEIGDDLPQLERTTS